MTKVKADKTALTEALRLLQPAVDSKNVALRQRIRLVISGESLVMTTSRGDLSIEATVTDAVEPSTNGTLVVGFRALGHAVTGAVGSWIELEREGPSLAVRSEDSEAKLPIVEGVEWPTLVAPVGEWQTWSDELLNAIEMATYAALPPGQNVLCGVSIGGNAAMTTDGYRGAVVQLPQKVGEAILPADVVRMVASAATDGCEVLIGPNSALWAVDNVRWSTSVFDGDFPDVKRLVDSNYPFSLGIRRGRIVDALEYVSFFQDVVRLDVTPGHISLSAHGDAGEVVDEFPAETDVSAVLFVRKSHLVDALTRVQSESVDLEIHHDGKRFRVGDSLVQHLVMAVLQPGVVSPTGADGRN